MQYFGMIQCSIRDDDDDDDADDDDDDDDADDDILEIALHCLHTVWYVIRDT